MPRLLPAVTASLLAVIVGFGAAKDKVDTVYIAEGMPLVSYDDQLDGPERRDYVFTATGGKELSVMISSKHDRVSFRVFGPDGSSIYNSRNGGDAMNQRLEASGPYTIQVHLPDAGAGDRPHYSLVIQQK